MIRRLFDEVYNDQNFDVLDELVADDVANHSATNEHKHALLWWTWSSLEPRWGERTVIEQRRREYACR